MISFSCRLFLLLLNDSHFPGCQRIEPAVLPLAGGDVKPYVYGHTYLDGVPLDVGVHQLQAYALRFALFCLQNEFPAFPFIAGSLADPVLDGKYGDDFSSYFHFYQYWVFNGLFIFADLR